MISGSRSNDHMHPNTVPAVGQLPADKEAGPVRSHGGDGKTGQKGGVEGGGREGNLGYVCALSIPSSPG